MATDYFANARPGLVGPGENIEVANYASGNYDFVAEPRFIVSSGTGILKVDTAGGQTNVSLPVVPGVNPVRITRVYQSGSTAGLTIVGVW